MTEQSVLILNKVNYPHATFIMTPANQKDLKGNDIPATVRNHFKHGDVKIFSGYHYSNNLEFRWSLSQDLDETDSEENILKRFGIEQ